MYILYAWIMHIVYSTCTCIYMYMYVCTCTSHACLSVLIHMWPAVDTRWAGEVNLAVSAESLRISNAKSNRVSVNVSVNSMQCSAQKVREW